MHEGEAIVQSSKFHEKTLSRTKVVRGPWKLSGSREKDQSLFSLLLQIESRLRTQAETIRLSSLDDPEKKIVSDRE
jgi:hypothetical protein